LCFSLILAAGAFAHSGGFAEDAFFEIPLSELKITAGKLPDLELKPGEFVRLMDPRWQAMAPTVVLDCPGEGYADIPALQTGWRPAQPQREAPYLAIRTSPGQVVTGRLWRRKGDGSGMALIRFEVPAAAAKESARATFYRTKLAHYEYLRNRDLPGTAWFRHVALEVSREQHLASAVGNTPQLQVDDAQSAYDLFSGGRAISENLQLNRALRNTAAPAEPTVKLDSLQGITIAQIDWKPFLKDAHPKLDPLSQLIPSDQHAIFFSSFNAGLRVADEANGGEIRLLQLANSRSEDANVVARYERQLGLSLTGLGRLLGPATVGSIALTGSDPYFPTGTDVAVLFESKNPGLLASLIQAQVKLASAKETGVMSQNGDAEGIAYHGYRTPDRRLCTYVAELKGTVVVTNSLIQLGRLARVDKDLKSIASLDEFQFFRVRYPLDDKNETGFVFLSDATIRRWCGPRWRIASARRTQLAAVLAELTAENLPALATGKGEPKPLHTDMPLVDAGELTLGSSAVSSSRDGTLAWMTPIVELPLEMVTKAEAGAYNLWRDQYQRNWRWAFDPIGLRMSIEGGKLAADLTVMPLIAATEYREALAFSRGAAIGAEDGDRHDTLAQVILSINTKSEAMKQLNNSLGTLSPQVRVEPLGWLGTSVSVYADRSPVWKEIAGMKPAERNNLRNNPGYLPVGVHVAVSNPLKLTGFLIALRAFVEQTAPGMVTWESLTYLDKPYVRIKPTQQGKTMLGEVDLALYYVPSAGSLTLTMNEGVLKRAIDRGLEREAKSKEQGGTPKAPAKASISMPWLGSNYCLQIDREAFDILTGPASGALFSLGDNAFQALMQVRSWSNLPILNEWKRLFPDQDPVALHDRIWGTKLLCPGGGKYVWNDEWKTMESTVYGHPGQPKVGPATPSGLARFKAANFGLTFEEQGLRARMELLRDAR
ncbi:MAG TPA: hypothetical protein VGP68_12500, partial [Gemmataceae bacterium]|nr:hypothetical protein [Gemmataceae bacterium]